MDPPPLAKRQRLDAACTYSHVIDPSFVGSGLCSDVAINIVEIDAVSDSKSSPDSVLIKAHRVVLMSNSSYFYAKVNIWQSNAM